MLRLTPSAWDQFRLDCDRSMDQADLLPTNVFGIEVCGPCGGQWVVEENRHGWTVKTAHAGNAPCRIIVSSAVFGELTSGSKTVAQAFAAGVLLTESDFYHDHDTLHDRTLQLGPSTGLIEGFSKLIAAVQRHASQVSNKSEVAYVR